MRMKHVSQSGWVIGLISIFIFSVQIVNAEPVTLIRSHGDSANRVDMVIMGDGYTSGELDKYAQDVERVISGFFSQEPFYEYQRYFNVHRVDIVSKESGVDHPERNSFRNTELDGTFDCEGIRRLVCVNTAKVDIVLQNNLLPNQRDIPLVIVNDSEYGGSGGAVGVASTNIAVIELVLHELGHSFGLLADEYQDSPPACNNTIEPSEPNVTMQTQPSLTKWNTGGGPPTGWIDLSTPIPTTGSSPGMPGLYEGARYCLKGLYRPTFNSKMRMLGFPFEQINEEQLVKRIYNFVSPLDLSIPTNSNVQITNGESLDFRVELPQPRTHSLTATWFLNDQTQRTGSQYILDSSTLDQGLHKVRVVIQDPTSKVRHDPARVLMEERIWDVEINPAVKVAGDFNADGCIDRHDLAILLGDIRGPQPHDIAFDLNQDGRVNVADARTLVGLFTNPRGAPCDQ